MVCKIKKIYRAYLLELLWGLRNIKFLDRDWNAVRALEVTVLGWNSGATSWQCLFPGKRTTEQELLPNP